MSKSFVLASGNITIGDHRGVVHVAGLTIDLDIVWTTLAAAAIVLLLGFLIKLRFPLLLDQFLPPHPHHQGLSQGCLITIWITYILSHADHHLGRLLDDLLALGVDAVVQRGDRGRARGSLSLPLKELVEEIVEGFHRR